MRPLSLAAGFLFLSSLAATAQGPVSTSHLKVLTSGGFAAPLAEILPEFQKASGVSVEVARGASQGPGPDTIGAQLRRNVPADMVIMSREGLNDLVTEGLIAPRSDVDLSSTPLGMAVRAGAPKPDITTLEAFRQTLLQAKSVTFPGSTSGIYLTKTVFPRLGIASEVAVKSSNAGVAAVSRGEVELAIQPESELLHATGTDFVGVLPTEVQFVSVFSAAVTAHSGNGAAARQFIDFLASGKAAGAMRHSGMSPMGTR
jgi:molybdate transport system substrate-binding protein